MPDLLDILHREWPVVSHAPYSFFISLLVLLILMYGVFEWRHRKRLKKLEEQLASRSGQSKSEVKDSGNSTATGGSATSTGNTLNQTFVLGEAAPKPKSESQPAAPPLKRKKPIVLEMGKVKLVRLHKDIYGTWSESDSGAYVGLIVPIYYNPTKSDFHTEITVKAHIVFEDEQKTIVPAACWLESYLNTVQMSSGDQKFICLAVIGQAVYATFHNRVETDDPFNDSTDGVRSIPLSRSPKKVEIVLIWWNDKTIFKFDLPAPDSF